MARGQLQIFNVGGVSPIEGYGITFDRRHWYFRGAGHFWHFAVSRLKLPPKQRSLLFTDPKDAVAVWRGGASGWRMRRMYVPRGAVISDPASYMAHSEARRFIAIANDMFRAGQVPKFTRPTPKRAKPPLTEWDREVLVIEAAARKVKVRP